MPTQPAILGTMRLGNVRLGYRPAALTARRATRSRITLAGVAGRVRREGLAITDALNNNPNTCTLTVEDPAPVVGQRLRVSINSDDPQLLFAGALQDTDLSYQGDPPLPEWPSTAIDDTAQANRRRPFGTWTNVSATTIGIYLAGLAGLSAAGIQAGLDRVSMNLDGSEGFVGGMTQLATLIGGDWKVDDGVAYLFEEDLSDPPDAIDDTPGRFLADPRIKLSTDDSQLLTRAFGKGHGETVLAPVLPGETIVPVTNAAAWFPPLGGHAISETQVLAYTGVQAGGAGSLAGPAAAPAVPPTPTLAAGGSLTLGDHQWAYVFGTAAGKSLPSPLSVVTTAQAYTPPTPAAPSDLIQAIANFNTSTAGVVIGHTYTHVAIFLDGAGGISAASAASNAVTAIVSTNDPAKPAPISVSFDVPNDPRISQAWIYRRDGAGALALAVTAFVSGPSLANQVYDFGGGSGAALTASASVLLQTATLAGIALGPTGTTYREIYQTAAGGTQLKLQQTIANNTATTATASLADASLGANAPTTDTSGLSTVAGQINAGSTSLLTSAWPFSSAGWVLIGQQVVRFTGVTGNTLTGIPATGLGALVTTVKYGEHIDLAPALTGVTGIGVPLVAGASVNIWVQRDDLAAQAEQAAIDLANGRVPADGVYEGPPIVDERRNEASLTALLDATLVLKSRPIQTVTYACRDLKSKSGKRVHFDVTNPPIGPVDLTIDTVTITEIDIAPGLAPKFTVTASSVAGVTLDGLLRKLLAGT